MLSLLFTLFTQTADAGFKGEYAVNQNHCSGENYHTYEFANGHFIVRKSGVTNTFELKDMDSSPKCLNTIDVALNKHVGHLCLEGFNDEEGTMFLEVNILATGYEERFLFLEKCISSTATP